MDLEVKQIVKTCFICPRCKTEWLDKSMAEFCLVGHIEPVEIMKAYYRKDDRYPKSVRVIFSDGSAVVYIHEIEVWNHNTASLSRETHQIREEE